MKYIILIIGLIIQVELTANNLFNSTPDSCQMADSLSLVGLYQASNGPDWNVSWDVSQPINSWHGVSLNANGCVTELNLSGNNLTGVMPAEIGNLTNLTELNLSRNLLTGHIPDNIENLTNLKSISLQKNQLTGQISSDISSLTNLEYLNLSFNSLQGQIPASIANLIKLVILDFQHNNLSGNIPIEFGELVNLQKIKLGYNQLTGAIPYSFSNLVQIEKFFLGNNNLSGCFDVALSSLCNVNPIFIINSGNGLDKEFYDFCMTGIGECDCSHTRLIENSIQSDSYNASHEILSSGQVNTSKNVLFSAGQTIELTGDFSVSNQAAFEAVISNCNE